jgi:hypothetical protein
VDIETNLKAYLGAREPTARYTSFDYCFNHSSRAARRAVSPSSHRSPEWR